MYQLCFYVPEDALDAVKEAVFAAGAGKIGEYDACCWQSVGVGQFRPSSNANPNVGECGQLTQVAEVKVEMVCAAALIKQAIEALIAAHPYEEPAYHCWRVSTLENL